jgi:hypothetical protein
MKYSTCLCLLLVAGCDALPRDPDGTLHRVRAERQFRVGIIAPDSAQAQIGSEQAFLRRVAAAAGARPVTRQGAAEPLLTELEEGRLDLVMGELAADTPWIGRVAMLPALEAKRGDQKLARAAVARNGENRWIMLLEREARAVAEDGGK